MGLSCNTDLATGQKVTNGEGAIIHLFHCTLSAQRTVQLTDPDLSSTTVHNFVMNIPESKKNAHPKMEGVPKQLWATHKYDVRLIKDATPLVVVPKLD